MSYRKQRVLDHTYQDKSDESDNDLGGSTRWKALGSGHALLHIRCGL